MINILNSLCTDAAGYKIFGFVGVLLTIIKIIIPILIVIMGSIDLVKAIMAQKDDEIKKGYSTLIKRVIIGVVIFFIPGIVGLIIGLTGSTENCESAKCTFEDSNSCISKANEMAEKFRKPNEIVDLKCENGFEIQILPDWDETINPSKTDYEDGSVMGKDGKRYICGIKY